MTGDRQTLHLTTAQAIVRWMAQQFSAELGEAFKRAKAADRTQATLDQSIV